MKIADQFFALLTLIVGVAVVAILISSKAQTVGVIQAFASGLSQLLQTVVSPVTGGNNQGY